MDINLVKMTSTNADLPLYPLRFKTIFKEKIWGGDKVKTILGKDFSPLKNCGETWEISGVAGEESVVSEGQLCGKSLPELIRTYKGSLVGNKIYAQFGDQFPLLIKFLDANDDLSIQVHPGDDLAKVRHNSFGKTEMWYIFQADEGAKLICGFKDEVDKETYLKHLETKTLDKILNQEEVKAGDVFFIPPGRVHTIGKGICIAEIQQTSDVTYRIYDFDRVDDNGNKRELHTELALDALDFKCYPKYKSEYEDKMEEPVNLVTSEYFTTNKIHFTKPINREYSKLDCFKIFICVEGEFTLKYAEDKMILKKGDTVLVPAIMQELKLEPIMESQVLEVYVD